MLPLPTEPLLFVAFTAGILALLALDLGVFHRRPHVVSFREAMVWTGIWMGLALAFNVVVLFAYGFEAAEAFLTAYLVEKSLSVDNMFVFFLIFSYFAVPREMQHRVLFWGILGALVMRALFIGAGLTLIAHFHWVLYVFGAFLVVTGIKMAVSRGTEVHPDRNPLLRAFRRWVPVTEGYEGPRFLVRRSGRWMATPLLVALLAVELTDVLFAVDSIPAILGVTLDPFIVWTSNVFAILGLRSLYFALAGLAGLFAHLRYGLAAILAFIGAKLLAADVVHVPTWMALGVVLTILLASVASSMWAQRRAPPGAGEHPEAAAPAPVAAEER